MKLVTRAGLAEACTNLSLAFLYGLFAYAHLLTFARTHRASTVVIVLMEALLAVLVLVRHRAERSSLSPWDWLITFGGTFAPLFLRPSLASQDVVAGQFVQVLGAAFAIASVLSLNRSFGLLPAHRQIKCNGVYRWVRHPLYAGYTVMNFGYLISNFSIANALIVAAALACEILRIFSEERFLSQYPAYADYRLRTRWRLFPYVF